MNTDVPTPREDLRHLYFGFRISQALHVVAQLGIADLLANGPRSVEDLAAGCGAHASSLARVLRLLASEGVFMEAEDGRYALTPMAAVLQRDAPGSLRTLALFFGDATLWRSWGDLLHAVQTGEPAFDHVHGVAFFEYFRRHPDEGLLFDELMAVQTGPTARAIAAAYDFTSFRTIVDVGGGRGALTLGLLAVNSHLRGVVFDQPSVAAAAATAIQAAGLTERCKAIGGDFFVAAPAGGDAYLLKLILHDWDDARCVTVLRACREVMPAHGRLLVIELLIPPGNAQSYAKSQDVNMLVLMGGRERSEDEYRTLFAAAGFELTRTIPALDELHVMEGVPV